MLKNLIRALRDDRINTVSPQPATDVRIAVSFVPGQCRRARPGTTRHLPDTHRVHHRLEAARFVHLPCADLDRQRDGATVSNQVQLAPVSAARAAQRVVFRLIGVSPRVFFDAPAAARAARTELPSTHHRSQSIRPSVSSRIWRASRIRS